jgi:hypothetical protein
MRRPDETGSAADENRSGSEMNEFHTNPPGNVAALPLPD